jgi:uridine kinase
MNKDIIKLYENINNPQDKTVIIVRGISGSGKSTFANIVAEPKVVCTADDYFEQNGQYNFDPSKLGEAHKQSMNKFDQALVNPNIKNIVVANTNVKPRDYKYYADKANQAGVRVIYVVLEKRHDNENVHSVPSEVLQRQHDSLKNDLKLM